MSKLPAFLITLTLLLGISGIRAEEALLKPGDRIVFVGDSITGQGGNGAAGWVALIGQALKEVDAANNQVLVALGGSGQTVGSWGNVELKSRTSSQILDVKKFDVRTELDQHADVVVIMLGMNDVLSAGLRDEPPGYEKWMESYRSLLTAIRNRTTPRIIALATPTPCTEDAEGPKNVVMDKMVETLKKLAQEEKCLVLPTRETAWEVLQKGRRLKPDFHITVDMVHPGAPGHSAIAAGMLRGLGEEKAAAFLLGKIQSLQVVDGASTLSYETSLLTHGAPAAGLRYSIRAYHNSGTAALLLPEGWKLEDTKTAAGETVFVVQAQPDHLINVLGLSCGSEKMEIKIPAPWLVGTANIGWLGWKGAVFDSEAGRLPSDEMIRTGTGFSAGMSQLELKSGVPVIWNYFSGGFNYGGLGAPGALDFAGVRYFGGGEVGYGLRWIQSEKERPVEVQIKRLSFAGNINVETWMNGELIYAGDPAQAKNLELKAVLKPGWNLLSFKSNFQQWQWIFSIDLEPKEGDSIEALRYSVIPPG